LGGIDHCRIAAPGSVDNVEAKAVFLRSYSKSVTIFAVGKYPSRVKVRALEKAGINVFKPTAMRVRDGGVEAYDANGATCRVDAVYPMLGCDVHSDLATNLGASAARLAA
jgi:hypothetical protein